MKRYPSAHHVAKTWVIVLVALVVALTAVAYWIFTQPPPQPDVRELTKVADKFLQQVREGEVDAAWQSTTVEFKSAQGKEHFKSYVRKKPVLQQPMEFIAAQEVSVQDRPRTELLYGEQKSGDTIRVLLDYEQNTWKVDRLLGID